VDGLELYLEDIARTFRKARALADGALAQVSDADLVKTIDADSNSLVTLVQHVSGNLRSRFTDFLTTDGEKPDRDRDAEFVGDAASRNTLESRWNESWRITLTAIGALRPADLTRTVYIRGEAFAVVEALNRAAAHTSYHVGQIVMLARHLAGPAWRTLSVPKGQSATYTGRPYKQENTPA